MVFSARPQHDRSLVRSTIAGLLVILTLFAAGGNVFMVQLDLDCEDHCDDSCENCSDCINCAPTLHMLSAYRVVNRIIAQQSTWLRAAAANHPEPIFATTIDHPPQNRA